MMRKRKALLIIVSYLLAAMFLITACVGEKDSVITDNDKKTPLVNGKYSPPITLRAFRYLGPQVKYLEGESLENNVWTKAYEEKLGIKLKYDFIIPDYQTFDIKVMGVMASGNLPDIIPVYTTLFFRLAKSGKLANLKEAYDKYLDPELKKLMEMYNNRALNTCTQNGILQAIASPPSYDPEMVWIRQDWLEKLGLQEPKTFDDIMNIAKAFAQKDPDGDGEDDTYGLALDRNLGGVNGFANSFHAYRGIWVEKEDGTLERGEIQPVWKTVLGKLKELYDAGAIDPEFIDKDSAELENDYAAERLGMVFATQTAPDGAVNKSVEANPDARWLRIPLISADDKPALGQVTTRIGDFTAVNKNCLYPEALMLLANLRRELGTSTDPDAQKYHDVETPEGDTVNTFWYPIGGINDPWYNIRCQENVSKAIETGDTTNLNGEERGYYKRMLPWKDATDPKKKAKGWSMWAIFGPDGSQETLKYNRENKLYYQDRGWGPETEAWIKNGPDLANNQLAYFEQIIIGDMELEQGWNNWVKYFNDNGGQAATKEVNDWWLKEGKAGMDK